MSRRRRSSTCLPRSGLVPASSSSAARTISSGSTIRPTPSSPSAVSPSSGPMRTTPRARSVSAFARVAACDHIRGFIAGATSVGPRCASAASVRTLSASPYASFASVLAVHGATTRRSARVRWRYTSSSGGRRASARNVSAVTNRSAPGVTSGTTSWPPFTSRRQISHALYAAIPPVTPSSTRAMRKSCLSAEGEAEKAPAERGTTASGRCTSACPGRPLPEPW